MEVRSGRDSCEFSVGSMRLLSESESCGGGVGCLYLFLGGLVSFVLPEEPSVYCGLFLGCLDFPSCSSLIDCTSGSDEFKNRSFFLLLIDFLSFVQ